MANGLTYPRQVTTPKCVGLLVNRQRYRCRECSQTFWERLEHTMDEKTIRNIFRDYVNRLEKILRFETAKWFEIAD